MRKEITTLIQAAELNLDKAIALSVQLGDLVLADRIRSAAFELANIIGVEIEEGDIEDAE